MALTELLAFAVGALRGHRLRTGLSVAGVAVGIAAVIALTALGEGARQYVVQEFSALGTNLLIVLPGRVEANVSFSPSKNDSTVPLKWGVRGGLKSSSMPSWKAASSRSLLVRSEPRSQTSFSGRPKQGQLP